MNNFLSELLVRYIDGKRWEVAESFTYRLGDENGSEFVHVGKGFVTDFASMPLNIVFRSPGGAWDKPAVIHDCLYRTEHVSTPGGFTRKIDRAEADRIFDEAMVVTETNPLARRIIYAGVRVGGGRPWRRYRKGLPETR